MGRVKTVVGQPALEAALSAAGGQLVVLDCFASWCGPCKAIAPTYEALSDKYPQVVFLKVQESDSADVIEALGVRAFPTFVFFLKKQKVSEMKGANPAALEAEITTHMAKAAPTAFSGAGSALGSGGVPQGAAADVRAARLARLEASTAAAAAASSAAPAAAAAPAPVAAAAPAPVPAPAPAPAAPAPAPAAPVPPPPAARFVPSPPLVSLLSDMGFGAARITRALRLTGNASVEAAIEWLEAHEDDAGDEGGEEAAAAAAPSGGHGSGVARDGTGPGGTMTAEDDAAVASAERDMQASHTRKLTAEEVSALLAKRRAEKAEKAKEEARLAEIRRREDGKKSVEMADELMAMRRKAEAAKMRAEKEAAVRERERLKLELLRDKAERISNSGQPVPPELMAEIAALVSGGPKAAAAVHAAAAAADVAGLSRRAQLEDAAKKLTAYKTPGTSLTAATTLRALCNNPLVHPGEPKYASVNLANAAIKDRVTSLVGGLAFLKAAGWVKNEAANTLVLPDPRDDAGLTEAVDVLDKALAAGWFGERAV